MKHEAKNEEMELILQVLELEERLKGRKLYHNLKYNQPEESSSQGPRACFTAEYGSLGKNLQERILKIDREEIQSNRAKIHQDNGCDTLNDFNMLVELGPDAYKHHVSPVVDFW